MQEEVEKLRSSINLHKQLGVFSFGFKFIVTKISELFQGFSFRKLYDFVKLSTIPNNLEYYSIQFIRTKGEPCHEGMVYHGLNENVLCSKTKNFYFKINLLHFFATNAMLEFEIAVKEERRCHQLVTGLDSKSSKFTFAGVPLLQMFPIV